MSSKSPRRGRGKRPTFTPVPTRARHDGWTPQKQIAFIEALAECACVTEACARVGISTKSAYALRRRVDGRSFREAWDIALDFAVGRLADAMFSRAIHGVARPVFFQGEQIGERRYYNDRLAIFLLRARDPVRYGAWRDRREHGCAPDGPAMLLNRAVDRVSEDAYEEAHTGRRTLRAPLVGARPTAEQEIVAEIIKRIRRDLVGDRANGENGRDVA